MMFTKTVRCGHRFMLIIAASFLPLSVVAMPGLSEKGPKTLVEQYPPAVEEKQQEQKEKQQQQKQVQSKKPQDKQAQQKEDEQIAKLKEASKSRSPDALTMRPPRFERLDKNSDGKMSLTEFKQTFPEKRSNVSLKEAFDHLDKDKSGNITEKEFESFVAHVQSIQKFMRMAH